LQARTKVSLPQICEKTRAKPSYLYVLPRRISHSEMLPEEEFVTNTTTPFCPTLYLAHSGPFFLSLSYPLILGIDFLSPVPFRTKD